ncbi:MAG: tyrosine-type recombinase/integrase [Candidatus Micrarchaeales archaeon]|nr:tyrosine-type recombinase/integrase [Candidatus Micrarchaeales archaeon]
MAYVDEAAKRTIHLVKAIGADRKIPDSNKKLAQKYIEYMQAKGLSERTINKNLYCLAVYLKAIGKTGALKAPREQIEKAMAHIEATKYSASTKQHIKVAVKSLYKHFLGEDLYYPKQVAWIKTGLGRAKKILPEDILSEDEVLKLINTSQNARNRAIIALMFDSGIRVGELLNMRMKDIDLADDPTHIIVNGKTGMRRIPIFFSVPYLANYVNSVKDRKPSDPMWSGIGSWTDKDKVVDYAGIRIMLKRAGKKAGIDKRIYPHLFRHSRASYYANKMTEQQLKSLFGWAGDSRMASTYVHLSGRDIDSAAMQANGLKPKEIDSKPKLSAVECKRCRNKNEPNAAYCASCGAPLEIQNAMRIKEETEKTKEGILSSIKDPELLDRIINLIAEAEQKKKRK